MLQLQELREVLQLPAALSFTGYVKGLSMMQGMPLRQGSQRVGHVQRRDMQDDIETQDHGVPPCLCRALQESVDSTMT
eukprot:1327024-Amphidinium_carterae.2